MFGKVAGVIAHDHITCDLTSQHLADGHTANKIIAQQLLL